MEKCTKEREVRGEMDNMRTKLDEAVSQHSKSLEEKFARMIASISKTFYEKIMQVTQITGGFEMLTKMQLTEWNQWRLKFDKDMKQLKENVSTSNIFTEINKEEMKMGDGNVNKILDDKLSKHSIVLDEKFAKTILSITKDFEDKIVHVTNAVRSFESQTQTQIMELNQWRLRFESEIQDIRKHLSIPYGCSKINNTVKDTTNITSTLAKKSLPRTEKKSTKGSETSSKNIVAVLDDLRDKVTAIQNKVNNQVDSSEVKDTTSSAQHNTKQKEKIKQNNDNLIIGERNPTETHTDKQSANIVNTFPSSDYGVKKFCGKLGEIEKSKINYR